MARVDYRELDEDDYYGQGFEQEGVLSFWVGLLDDSDDTDEPDVLQDLCGVCYYDLDYQEGNCHEFALVPLRDLVMELSWARSYGEAVLKAASERGLEMARWVTVQYNFAYDPQRIKRPIAADPIFLGIFPYSTDD
jgi:hypothetical protein